MTGEYTASIEEPRADAQAPVSDSVMDLGIARADLPHEFYPAEKKLLEHAARGEECVVGADVPAVASESNRMRAEFLRFLLLGGSETTPVHPGGVWLRGAYIAGELRLHGCQDLRRFGLRNCYFDSRINLRDANVPLLYLRGCRVTTIDADRVRVLGDVFLNSGFKVNGQVRLLGAHIGGNLECSGGIFHHCKGVAINCDGATIGGDVFLRNGFEADGAVRFAGAEIGGQFSCIDAKFNNFDDIALDCSRAKIGASVYVCSGFAAAGEVRFVGAEIAGNVNCYGGIFRNLNLNAKRNCAADALNFGGAEIRDTLRLGPRSSPYNQQVIIEGSMTLAGAHVGTLVDHPNSWPVESVQTTKHGALDCIISLNGFTYNRLRGAAPTDAETRRRWLRRQSAGALAENFRPQPFEQLIKVLRGMGHDEDARQIAMFKQEISLPLQVKRSAWWRRPFVWLVGRLWGLSCGYGYRPHRLVVALIVLWLGCGGAFQVAADAGALIPADAQVWTNERLGEKCEPNWIACAAVEKALPFNAMIYSADILIPIIDLRQRSVWTPTQSWIRAIAWMENILGSLSVLLLGAILSGLVKRD